ncbi:MAG: GNAT family N-acetyltransferase [Cyanobacteria bacterium P01_D01_bin.73]
MPPSPTYPTTTPTSVRRPSPSINIRVAHQKDIATVSDLLAASFHKPTGWLGWLYPLLRAGIHEDLSHRLRQPSQHYACLTAIDTPIDTPTVSATADTSSQRSPFPAAIASSCFWRPKNQQSPWEKQHNATVIGTVEIAARSQFPLGWRDPSHLYISNLAIAKSHRRQGIATALLQECEHFAKRWGFTSIHLHVLEDNQAARQLYREAGYHTEAALADWFSRLLGRSRRLLMCKKLDDSITP